MVLVTTVLRAHVYAHPGYICAPTRRRPGSVCQHAVGPPSLGPVGPSVYDCKPCERTADALRMTGPARNTAGEAYTPTISRTPCDDRIVRATPWTSPDPCPIPSERTTPWRSQGAQLQYDMQKTQHNVVLTAQLSGNLHRKWEAAPPRPLIPTARAWGAPFAPVGVFQHQAEPPPGQQTLSECLFFSLVLFLPCATPCGVNETYNRSESARVHRPRQCRHPSDGSHSGRRCSRGDG